VADFITAYIGQLSALMTSVLWTTTSTFFTLGGRQVGSVVLNRTRLLFAVAFLLLAHLILGVPLPLGIETERLLWLSLSGVIGLVIGDALLFQGFVMVGPRISMLMMSLAPVIASLLAWMFLDEILSLGQIAGMLLTLIGISLVVLEGNGNRLNQIDQSTYFLGVLLAFGGAAGQATGLVAAKQGLSGDFPALSGTLVRMVAAVLVMWLITIIRCQAGTTIARVRKNPRALRFIVAGAFTGPFLGVTFSLVAVQNTEVGIASTLMALPPVLLLPVGYFVFNERFGWQAILGTLIAISGVGVLFLA